MRRQAIAALRHRQCLDTLHKGYNADCRRGRRSYVTHQPEIKENIDANKETERNFCNDAPQTWGWTRELGRHEQPQKAYTFDSTIPADASLANFREESSEQAIGQCSTGTQDAPGENPSHLAQDAVPRNEQARKMQDVRRPYPSKVYPIAFDTVTINALVQTLRLVRSHGLPESVQASQELLRQDSQPRRKVHENHVLQDLSASYQRGRIRRSLKRYNELYIERAKLPVHDIQVRNYFLKKLHTSEVIVLVSETGSGKSTQIPQQILESHVKKGLGAFCNILCTQPRRIAAISVANRVAEEQQTLLGPAGHVGYSVRFRYKKPGVPGSIHYMTNGILLKALNEQPLELLSKYSHIIVDEVHERDVACDLVLAHLRDHLRKPLPGLRRMPKIILMSATLDVMDFQTYFGGARDHGPPIRVLSHEVQGRNYQVEVHMLEQIMQEMEEAPMSQQDTAHITSITKYLREEDDFAGLSDMDDDANIEHSSGEEAGLASTSFINEDQVLDNLSSIGAELNTSSHEIPKTAAESAARKQPAQLPLPAVQDRVPPPRLMALVTAFALRSSPDTEGDVLVFLPGLSDMDDVERILLENPIFGLNFTDTERFRIFKLHSTRHDTNEMVFDPVPAGCRRIVLATNIAQTSITLPDIVHVVDSGMHKVMEYNPALRMSAFSCLRADKSSTKQRRGRAGRTQPGHYWAVYTQARYDAMEDTPKPKVQVEDITSHCLALKASRPDEELSLFFSNMMDPPPVESVEASVDELKKLRMLTEEGTVTPLGNLAALLPSHPATGRSLVLGALFGCLEPILIMAAHSSDKPLIYNPISQRENGKSILAFTDVADDDRFPFITAFRRMTRAAEVSDEDELRLLTEGHVRKNVYSEMCEVSRQLHDLLSDRDIVPKIPSHVENIFPHLSARSNSRANSTSLIKALGLSMQFSNLSVWNSSLRSWTTQEGTCLMNPFSVNARSQLRAQDRAYYERFDGELMSHSMMLDSAAGRPFIHQSASVTPLTAMLFGGPIKVIDDGIIEIDGWLKYRVSCANSDRTENAAHASSHDIANLILEFRRALDRYIQLACLELGAERGQSRSTDPSPFGRALFANDSKLAQVFADSLQTILDADSAQWDEQTHLSADAIKSTLSVIRERELTADRRAESILLEKIARLNARKPKLTW